MSLSKRTEWKGQKKIKILHVTKILNFIFLTHCNRTDKPMD